MYILKFLLAAIFIIITFTSTALSQTESIRFKYRLTGDAHVTLEIRTGPGGSATLIKTILNNQFQSEGPYLIIWDGTNNDDKEVASGLYYYRIRYVINGIERTKNEIFRFIK